MTLIDGNAIATIFNGVDEDWRALIRGNEHLKSLFGNAVVELNKLLQASNKTVADLQPPLPKIMEAFRLCPLKNTQVVLIGQDPYPEDATGLSFSLPPSAKKLSPSIRSINECLHHHKLLDEQYSLKDLSHWARQGVLMINTMLTYCNIPKIGKSGTPTKTVIPHKFWQPFTDELIRCFSMRSQAVVFILWGDYAHAKENIIARDRQHVILKWGHPSPLSTYNKTDNPQHFKYCNAFTATNQHLITLGRPVINWAGDIGKEMQLAAQARKNRAVANMQEFNQYAIDNPSAYVFCDGGSTGNGYKHSQGSWAYHIITPYGSAQSSGLCEHVEIKGEKYTTSNNRGELTAIINGLTYLLNHMDLLRGANNGPKLEINVVSDSEYSIKSVTMWYADWVAKNTLADKKNLDLIAPAYDLVRKFTDNFVIFNHVRGHQPTEPADKKSKEWFYWKGNDIVDSLCTEQLQAAGKK